MLLWVDCYNSGMVWILGITCYWGFRWIVLYCQCESNWYCSLHTCTPEDWLAITDCIPTSNMLCYCILIGYATADCIATPDDCNCVLNMLQNVQNFIATVDCIALFLSHLKKQCSLLSFDLYCGNLLSMMLSGWWRTCYSNISRRQSWCIGCFAPCPIAEPATFPFEGAMYSLMTCELWEPGTGIRFKHIHIECQVDIVSTTHVWDCFIRGCSIPTIKKSTAQQ